MSDLPPGALPTGSVPGPPPTLWSPSLSTASTPFAPPLAVWHPHWRVWVALELGDVLGDVPPPDAVLLSPAVGSGE